MQHRVEKRSSPRPRKMAIPKTIISEEEGTFECVPCQRRFINTKSLDDHCRNAGIHAGCWCERCLRLFTSPQSLQQHIRSSSEHCLCARCSFDAADNTVLRHHYGSIHQECWQCDTFGLNEESLKVHWEDEHHICPHCDRMFSGTSALNELQQVSGRKDHSDCRANNNKHKKTHMPRSIACTGCNHAFAFASAVVLHQEIYCQGGMDSAFINQLARITLTPDSPHHPDSWKCTCGYVFSTLSGLMQHAENTPSCPKFQSLGGARRFLDIVTKPAST
jgi:hypothetical protein